MRILIDYRPALRERTGVGEYAHELSAAVASQLPLSHGLTLFSSSWKDRLHPGTIPNVPIVDARVPVTLLNLAWHRLGWPPVESFAGEVDIAHSMHPLLMPARRAAQIVTIYDLYFLEQPQNTAAEIKRDYPSLAGAHARQADAVITISEYTAAKIRSRLSVPAESIAICPPGAPAWRPANRYQPRGPILFVGTIEPRKNIGRLLDAYATLLELVPDAPGLMLAGKAAPSTADVMARLAHPPFSGRVTHVGYVSGPEREDLYRQASMLVVPSLDEGFGMTALEAMTIGIPVVASNRGALPEVTAGAALLVDPDDASALAGAMLRVLTEASTARASIEQGLVRARHFTWAASAERLRQAYASAIERRRARR
ncbi:MAG TPA: glycosyltransferase family 1 protein [Vicinamibacterales bacterium]|nr:glycosyltransferase family 1 protein [Vicinamibacterales bacterium]